MHTYQITDTGSNWVRTTTVTADSRDAAQEQYIDQCEADDLVFGTLSIRRVGA